MYALLCFPDSCGALRLETLHSAESAVPQQKERQQGWAGWAIKEQAYYVGLNLKHLRQQNITTSSTAKTDREQTRSVRSQGATQMLRSPRAFLADLHSCNRRQGAFAFSPNEELAHAQCPRQSDIKPISLADAQQKTERKGRKIEFAPHRDVQLWYYACRHSESVQFQ